MLINYTDAEIARAVHFIDAHDDGLEGSEARAWQLIKQMIVDVADQQRDLDREG